MRQPPPPDQDGAHAYREARGLLEGIATAADDAARTAAIDRAAHYLTTHCPNCGARLVGAERDTPTRLCRLCQPPAPDPISDMPARPTPPPIPATLAAWPVRLQPVALRFWHEPAVQRLIAALADAGYQLPIRPYAGQYDPRFTRRALLHDPAFMAPVIAAAQAGVGVRRLAVLLFGAAPGEASDMIARALDEQAPGTWRAFDREARAAGESSDA